MRTRSCLVLVLFLGAALASACGDDDLTGGGGPGQTGGSGPTGGSNDGGGAGSQGGSGDGGSAGDGGAGVGGGGSACVPADVLAELNAFLTKFAASAELLAGHPGPSEATGFYLAPGLPEPPAIAAIFAGPLIMVCSDPLLYDPYCDMGRCSRLECTGEGASWDNHFYLDDPVQSGEFAFTQLDIDHQWADGAEGTTFDFTLIATGPQDRVWDASGTGALGPESGSLELTFPQLLGHAAVLTFLETPSSHEGSLVVDEIVVAELTPLGQLEATGECP